MPFEAGWQERTLGELCSLRRELVEPSSTGVHRYVGLEHIDPGLPSLRRWGADRDVKSTKSRFYPGDILYGKLRPYLDKAAVAEWEGLCSTDILTLQPHKDEADYQYIGFLLHTSAFLSYAVATTSGINHPLTSWADIARFSYPVPPVQEQRAIAGVLSNIQAAVEVQGKIVAALKELKAATMATLFREGLRGEPLKQTEIGEIPESWEVVPVGEYCEKPRYGHTESARSDPVGPTFLRITDIGATTGKSYFITDRPEAVFASYLIRLRAKPRLDPAYLSCFFESEAYWSQIRANKGANLKGGMSASMLSTLLFPLPPLEEQKTIAATVKAIEQEIASIVKRRDILTSLFSSILHLLMTGQVRVSRKMIALQEVADRAARRPKWSGTVDTAVLQEIVRRIVEAVAPEKIILFGSAARGEMGPDSDIDLLVVKACDRPRDVAALLRRKLIGVGNGLPKDIIVVTPEHLDKHKDTIGYIYRPALREGKVLYAR
jgi:type I restriction enzyme S subunit